MNQSRAGRVARVAEALDATGIQTAIRRLTANTATAVDAALALNCEVGAIAKSLVFRGVSDDGAVLAILSGARRVSLQKLSQAVGGSVSKANAAFVKEKTGFEIGGVPPIGHNDSLRIFMDDEIRRFEIVLGGGRFGLCRFFP